MRVLILSMTVGQGHNSAGKALAQYLEKNGHETEIIDTYKFLNKLIGEAMDKGYSLMGRSVPKLNEIIYEQAEKVNGRSDMRIFFPFVFSDIHKSKMEKYILSYKPDAIVCTHVFPAILLTQLKETHKLSEDIMLYGINTDYSLHPFWEYTNMHYFVAANELLIPHFIERNIPKEKILPFGIPVKEEFSYSQDKPEARKKLGLAEDMPTCLITSGGRGFGAVKELVRQADKVSGIQIVAICGTNAALKKQLESKKYNNPVHILGYVNNMHEYLDACDIIVTKPGGLSTSESMAKNKTIILTPPLPGVENMNLIFMQNNFLALHTNKYMPLSSVLENLSANPAITEVLKNACSKWGKPQSSKTLGDFIINKFKEKI